MKLVVITPVGPGHNQIVERCIRSVKEAEWSNPTISVIHRVIDDTKGRLGRSKARNIGMEGEADWFFFLDADDLMCNDALMMNDEHNVATFGSIKLIENRTEKNVYPCDWPDIARDGASGTLSMGFFCRADVAKELRFNEDMDRGEDFEFYLRLPSFTKVDRPLVRIGNDVPSAGGPKGYRTFDWTAVCNDLIVKAYEKDPHKFRIGRDALLDKAGGPNKKSRELSQAVR